MLLDLGPAVALLVEVDEEEQEEEPVEGDVVDEHPRVRARRPEHHLQLMREDRYELHLKVQPC